MAADTVYSDFGAQENKICLCFHFFLFICHGVMEPNAFILVFWMLNSKPAFSLSSLTFVKKIFSSSSLFAISEYGKHHLCVWVVDIPPGNPDSSL